MSGNSLSHHHRSRHPRRQAGGMRFAVEHLIGYLDAGMSEEELLAQLPFLEADDIAAAKLFAALQD